MVRPARSKGKGSDSTKPRAARPKRSVSKPAGAEVPAPKSRRRRLGAEAAPAPDHGRVPAEAPRPSRLPPGRPIDLPGRGRIYFREIPGPENAPVVVLLHGWLASGALNWAAAFDTLGEHFRVIAPDQRGHGRGIRSWSPFRLEDCADDAAALLEALGIVKPGGESYGGLTTPDPVFLHEQLAALEEEFMGDLGQRLELSNQVVGSGMDGDITSSSIGLSSEMSRESRREAQEQVIRTWGHILNGY